VETILRAYGVRDRWAEQTRLAAALCARLPEFKHRFPAAGGAIERYYPQFEETYQPELAELLIDRGLNVISTRTSSGPGGPDSAVWSLLRDHLRAGHLAVIHVPGHYLAATGIEESEDGTCALHYVDPGRPNESFSIPCAQFGSGRPFAKKRNGDDRPGWDGRVLIFWQPDKQPQINVPHRCPACREHTPANTFRYCRTCRVLVERRESNAVQRAIDAISDSRRSPDITSLDARKLHRTCRYLIATGKFDAADLKTALLHYPLPGGKPDRLQTLQRYAASEEVDLTGLSLYELIAIVAAGRDWPRQIRRHGA
jgi:hypothetical protein